MLEGGRKIAEEMRNLILLFVLVFSLGCTDTINEAIQEDLKIGDCVTHDAHGFEQDIVKVVTIERDHYVISTHIISNGRVVQAQNYERRQKVELNSYLRATCP